MPNARFPMPHARFPITRMNLLVTDLDNTLVGDDQATLVLNQRLESQRSQFCLVYATGRSYASTCELIVQKQLLAPDYLITGMGTEIYQDGILDLDWAEYLSQNWDKIAIASFTQQFSQLQLRSPNEQNPWKFSFSLELGADIASTVEGLQQKLDEFGLAAQIICTSNCQIKILPETSNKGNALTYLQKRLNIQSEATLVCGDSGNDISMFEQDVRGVIVANALPEMLEWYRKYGTKNHYLASSSCAAGVMEGMKYFWGL
jgi:sucrose-6-phosphatase